MRLAGQEIKHWCHSLPIGHGMRCEVDELTCKEIKQCHCSLAVGQVG